MFACRICFFVWLLMMTAFAQAAPPVVIRTVFQEGFPVKYNADDPENPGICIEVIRAMEKADPGMKFTGLDVRASTVRILRMLETHEIDMFVGIGRTPDREKNLTWLTPVVFAAHPLLFVRKDDPADYRSIEEVRALKGNNTILVNFGTVQDEMLQDYPGLRVDRGGTDTGKNLQKLMLGRGRFYFGSDLNTIPVIRSMGISPSVRSLKVPFPAADNYVVMASKADPALRDRLQAVLGKLSASGELERIFQKYVRY